MRATIQFHVDRSAAALPIDRGAVTVRPGEVAVADAAGVRARVASAGGHAPRLHRR
jgi:regulator of RNase E activity RraA